MIYDGLSDNQPYNLRNAINKNDIFFTPYYLAAMTCKQIYTVLSNQSPGGQILRH